MRTRSATKKARSIASTLPFELVEHILLETGVSDLLMAAAHVPRFWHEVIEQSTGIRSMVTEEFACQIPRAHRPNPNRMMAPVARCLTRDMRWMFRSYLTDGALYVDRRCKGRAEEFLFVSAAEERPLCLINPARTIAKYHVSGRFGQGFIECFDFDGELVCSKQVSRKDWPQPHMDHLWTYLSRLDPVLETNAKVDAKADADAKAATRKVSLRRKLGGLRYDGDSEVMARS